jgi:hypothetical protein
MYVLPLKIFPSAELIFVLSAGRDGSNGGVGGA